MSAPAPPFATNNTASIYRSGVSPPAAAALDGVPCLLIPDWQMGQERGDRQVNTLTWTHIMLIHAAVDIRDCYAGGETAVAQDTVYIPDGTGTPFNVIFIEPLQAGTANACKRVYLDRQVPPWGSSGLPATMP